MDRQIATVFTNKPLKQCMGTADNIVPLGCYFMYVHNLSVLSSIGHWPFEATAQKGNEFHVRGQNEFKNEQKVTTLCILDYLSFLTNKCLIILYLGPDLGFKRTGLGLERPNLGFERPDLGS